MDARFADLIDKLGGASTPERIHAVMEQAVSRVGARWFIVHYGVLAHGSERSIENAFYRDPPAYLTTFPSEWIARYLEQRLYRVDPVVQASYRALTPVLWHEAEASADEAGRAYFQSIRALGLMAGLSVPVHGHNGEFGTVGIVFDHDDAEVRSRLEAVQFDFHPFALNVISRLRQTLVRSTAATSTVRLTPRELEVLRWTAAGKTIWEIGRILSLSERTAKQHLGSAMRKLNASTKFQAVAEAVARGLTLDWVRHDGTA